MRIETPLTLPPVTTLVAGLVAGLAFALFSRNMTGGPFFLYIPAIPLLYVGLMRGATQISLAALIAFFLIMLLADIDTGMFFLLILALPASFFVRKLLLWREGHAAEPQWYPLLIALTELTVISAALFMALSLAAQHSFTGGLQMLIAQELTGKIITDDPQLLAMLQYLTHEGSFILFVFMAWSWALTLFFFTFLAQRVLEHTHTALRPSLRLTPAHLPGWLFGLVLISGLLGVLGQGITHFEGETVFVILMLPYFLSGITLLQAHSAPWRRRTLWLCLIYIAIFVQLWPGLLLIGMGIYTQLAEMLDSTSEIG